MEEKQSKELNSNCDLIKKLALEPLGKQTFYFLILAVTHVQMIRYKMGAIEPQFSMSFLWARSLLPGHKDGCKQR